MSARAQRTLERFEQRRPDAFRLAVLASLAVRVDAHLLRRLRTLLTPDADVGAEADLWFSPLVESRGAHGFVVAADMNALLRELLAADAALLQRADRVTAAAHRDAPATIRIEEKVNALALRAGEDVVARIDEALRPAVLAMVRDEASGMDIARWAARALPRFHPRVHEAESAALLAIGAAARLGSRIARPDVDVTVGAARDHRWVLPAAVREQRAIVGVELLADGVRFVAEGEGSALPLPRTSPLLVHLLWTAGGEELRRTVEARPGRTERLGTTVDEVRFRTIAGEEFRFRADPVRTGVDASLVEVELLGSNGPTAAGFIVAPDRIVTAAQPFRGVPILAVTHGSRSFQARVVHPRDGSRPIPLVDKAAAAADDILVLAPIDSPPLSPVLPLEWRLGRIDPRQQNTLIVDTTAEMRWIESDGEVVALDGDMGVQHDGPDTLTVTVERTQPPSPPPRIGGPVLVRDKAVGVVTRVEGGGLLPQNVQPGGPFRIQAVGSIVIEKVLEALQAPREDFRVAQVPVIDLRRERSGDFAPAVLGFRRDRWNLLEIRNAADPPGLTADVYVHAISEAPGWPRPLDVEEAAAVILVADPREDPDASHLRRTLAGLTIGWPPYDIPVLVVTLDDDPPSREYGRRIERDATSFLALRSREPDAPAMLHAALGPLVRWENQPGGTRDEFDRLRRLLARVEGKNFPPAMPLAEFVKEAGDIRAAHAARIAGARILESGGDTGVAILDETLFERMVVAIMDTGRAGVAFNGPLPVIPLEEMRRVVHRVLDEFRVSSDLYHAVYDGLIAELVRIGVLGVGRGVDGDWLVYPGAFEPQGPIGDAPRLADPVLVARSDTPALREMLLVALDLLASEQYDLRGAYWRTPPRQGVELADRRDGAPLYIEYEPGEEFSIVLRVAYGTDPGVAAGLADGVEQELRRMPHRWITIERPDAAGRAASEKAPPP